jgi:hypothetical protein
MAAQAADLPVTLHLQDENGLLTSAAYEDAGAREPEADKT